MRPQMGLPRGARIGTSAPHESAVSRPPTGFQSSLLRSTRVARRVPMITAANAMPREHEMDAGHPCAFVPTGSSGKNASSPDATAHVPSRRRAGRRRRSPESAHTTHALSRAAQDEVDVHQPCEVAVAAVVALGVVQDAELRPQEDERDVDRHIDDDPDDGGPRKLHGRGPSVRIVRNHLTL